MHCPHGPTDFWIRSSTIDSSFARVSFFTRCFGPLASAVMKGRLISVSMVCGEFDLRPLGRVAQTQSHLITLAARVRAFILLELVDEHSAIRWSGCRRLIAYRHW